MDQMENGKNQKAPYEEERLTLVRDGRIPQIVRRLHGLRRPDQDFSVEGGNDQILSVARPMKLIRSFDMERFSFCVCREVPDGNMFSDPGGGPSMQWIDGHRCS